MERDKKRGREEEVAEVEREKAKKPAMMKGEGARVCTEEVFEFEDGEILKLSESSFRPLAVFEFPWQKELASEAQEWKVWDAFYSSSLIDNCDDASTELSGEGFCQIPAPLSKYSGQSSCRTAAPLEKEESEASEIDGVDCIWSCVLSQPLVLGRQIFLTRNNEK